MEGPAGDPPPGRPGPGGGARQHVVGGAAGEGQQQHSAGLHTLPAQPGRARHQRARLPGTGSGKNQQRAAWVRRRPALFFVQPVQQARRIEHEHECNQLIRHGQAATRGEHVKPLAGGGPRLISEPTAAIHSWPPARRDRRPRGQATAPRSRPGSECMIFPGSGRSPGRYAVLQPAGPGTAACTLLPGGPPGAATATPCVQYGHPGPNALCRCAQFTGNEPPTFRLQGNFRSR